MAEGGSTLKRHYRPDQNARFLLNITPETAQWKYISFKVAKLRPNETIEADTATHEVARKDLFRELADVAYLPPRTKYKLEAIESFEVAVGGAPAECKLPSRIIRRNQIPSAVRGGANAERGVSTLADSDELTERLVVYEIHTPSGNWSSFPPHRHDTRDNSSYHEETYYYRFLPENGFAIQRIYTRDTDLDVAIPVQHGDVVLIHEGYHPVVKAPGTNAYYLNFLAGDVRKISAVNDPFYDWVSKNWEGNPIEIPLKG